MNELFRALVVLAAYGTALGLVLGRSALVARARRRAVQSESLRPWPAAVLFTSDDCDACHPVRDTVTTVIPAGEVRELRYQGDGPAFRRAGIDRVPTVVVVDGYGVPVGVFEGQVSSRQIRRAGRAAGLL